jgi:hypothetical protein
VCLAITAKIKTQTAQGTTKAKQSVSSVQLGITSTKMASVLQFLPSAKLGPMLQDCAPLATRVILLPMVFVAFPKKTIMQSLKDVHLTTLKLRFVKAVIKVIA